MERIDLEDWIANHPDSVHADSKTLLDQGEHDALDHAHRDAWLHAKEIAQKSLRGFQGSSGCPASDTFVAREVCHEMSDREEHSTWMEIVKYADHHANNLIQKGHLTDQCDWDLDHRYSLLAARVLKMLIADFEARAAESSESAGIEPLDREARCDALREIVRSDRVLPPLVVIRPCPFAIRRTARLIG